MFKKREIKKTNVLDEFEKNKTSEPTPTEGTEEPVLKKKVKTKSDFSFSTKEITEEYGRIVNDQTGELMYKARPELITKDAGNAFATNEIDTIHEHDIKARRLRQLELSKEIKAGKVDKKYYHGEAAYAVYAEKSEKDIHNSKYTGTLGPIRAPSNVRASCRIDYNPSLCKDWHDTGYCGFGDSCIYVHDRTDYKSGWELEKEWEREQAERAKRFSVTTTGNYQNEEEEEEEEDDGLPKVCQLCEEEFKEPVKTSCQHFFCEKCIMEHYKSNKRCPVCSRALNGIFNTAMEIITKMKAMAKDSKKNKKERILIGEKREGAKGSEEEEGEPTGLEGVEFATNAKEDEYDEEREKRRMEKLARELKNTVSQQKEKFAASETDWQY